MAKISVTIDDDLKEQAEDLFEKLGLNMSTAINIFIHKCLAQGGIPFKVTTQKDSYFNHYNMERLAESKKQLEQGKTIEKTLSDLEKMEKD